MLNFRDRSLRNEILSDKVAQYNSLLEDLMLKSPGSAKNAARIYSRDLKQGGLEIPCVYNFSNKHE